MPSSYTTSLRLILPATGELAGQWGAQVNQGITELLDAAVAGTTTISTWGGAGVAYTLSNNSGTADEARRMFIVATGTPGEAKNVICPAVSKFYVFRNDTTGGFALTLKTFSGTGIAVPAGQYKFLYCDGTNVVEMFNSAGALTLSGALSVGGTTTLASNPTLSAGTANQVQYLNASKVLTGSANLTFDGTSLGLNASPNLILSSSSVERGRIVTGTGAVELMAGSTTTPTISMAANVATFTNNPVLSGGTANGVLYLNGSKVATSGSALTFDGTNVTTTGYAAGNGIRSLGGNAVRFYNSANANWSQISAPAGTGDMQFDTGAGEQMRLTSTGLGIGTSSPLVKFDVKGTTDTHVGITASGIDEAIILAYDDGGIRTPNLSYGAASHKFLIDTTERMRLDSSGNLGLGVTPSAWQSAWKVFQASRDAAFGGSDGGAVHAFVSTNAYATANASPVLATWLYKLSGSNAALYDQFGGAHRWFNAGSGTAGNTISFTQAMSLDASGNLGVGTTSPAQRLDVRGTTSATIRVGSTGNGGSGDEFGNLEFYWGDPDAAEVKAKIYAKNVGNVGPGGGGAADLLFATTPAFGSSTERARITSGGDLLVGTTTASGYHRLNRSNTSDWVVAFTNASATTPWGVVLNYSAAAPNNTSPAISFSDTGGERATIRNNGGLANYSGNNVNLSDRREKTNFAPAKSYLDTICAIPVQTFEYIDQSEDDPGLTLGVVAQDVQAVAPELVMESNWGTEDNPKMRLSIYQTDLQYALMKCIQEQQALITALTARVAALEAQP